MVILDLLIQSILQMIFKYKVYNKATIREYLLQYHLSKSKIYTLFLEKRVLINDVVAKENNIVDNGDIVSIILNEKIDYKPVKKKLDIVYEDDYLLIFNKQKGIIIHDDNKDKTNSLSNIVAGYYQEKGYDLNVRFCHRLDFDTTGIIIYAKDILMHSYINYIISTHELKRYYLAIVEGKLNVKEGVINLPIGDDRHNSKRKRVSNTGSPSITNYKVIKEYKDYSLVSLLLETGRTHQIRVHMSYIGHPLIGDTLYGGSIKYLDRIALHSYKLFFYHLALNKNISLEIELPKDMMELL